MTPQEIVEKFIDDWNQMNWTEVMDALSDDVVYHNIPMERLEGKEAARAFIMGMEPKGVDWQTLSIAANGNKVLTERIDAFDMGEGKTMTIPVMGTFEITDGKISAWRDYFDLATLTSQMS